MGLPLFIVPVEPEVAAKAVEKSASGSRSSIRRQRAMRGLNRVTSESRRRRQGTRDNLEELEELMEPESFSTLRQRNEPPGIHGPSSFFDPERMRLRDTLSFERENLSTNETDGTFMPPVPESRDYSGTRDRQREMMRLRAVRQDLRRMARRRPDLGHNARDGPSNEAPMSLTSPDESPQHLSFVDAADSVIRESTDGPDPIYLRGLSDRDVRMRAEREASAAFNAAARLHETGYARQEFDPVRAQALNIRASNNLAHSRRLLRQARLDGLGDRDRSLSPENGAAWDTLLTSITPDPQPPSAGSSFASAGASASTGTGGRSASTSMTSLNSPEELPALRDCDVSESNSDDEEEDIYELQEPSRTRPESFWRSYADVATTRAHRAARNGGTDADLEGMHRIISGLASRDEIPDEWWTSAGLSRNLRREPAI